MLNKENIYLSTIAPDAAETARKWGVHLEIAEFCTAWNMDHERGKSMKKVIGIGACVLDTVICCDTYPTEDKKMRASDVFSTGGGPVSNALVAITRLGLSASFLGALSDSPEGHRLADEFVRYGVGVEGVRFVENTRAFTSYIVLSAESGSRTCVFERGNVPDEPEKLDLTAIRDILNLFAILSCKLLSVRKCVSDLFTELYIGVVDGVVGYGV